jgi:hypothetical protein
VELHAQHLYHGQGALKPLKGPVKLRARIFERGLEAVRVSRARIFLTGVEWNDALVEDALATHRLAALRRLLGHLERYCEEHDLRALTIADEEETSAAEVVAVTRLHQESVRTRTFEARILDAPLFTPSHWSYGVQSADLVTFVNARRHFGRDDGRHEDSRAAKVLDGWWGTLEPQIEVWEYRSAPAKTDGLLRAKRTRGHA